MEDTHGAIQGRLMLGFADGLNPYYNGRYSWSAIQGRLMLGFADVLILIIMEDTHGYYKVVDLR